MHIIDGNLSHEPTLYDQEQLRYTTTVAEELRRLMSKRDDLVRLLNSKSIGCLVSESSVRVLDMQIDALSHAPLLMVIDCD